ncbi:hypothetical protein [Lysobacter gummosus]|uniref:hypothetical protein n=1 Tax=Lysobacter gummosus TaxID=262324 RepID=UPI00363D28D0
MATGMSRTRPPHSSASAWKKEASISVSGSAAYSSHRPISSTSSRSPSAALTPLVR